MPPERVRKSVFVVHSHPVKGNLTLKARKLTVALARSAGQQYRRLTLAQRTDIEDAVRAHVGQLRAGVVPDVPPVLFQPRFTARLRDLADLVGHDPSDSRHLLEDMYRLVTTEVMLIVLQHGAAEAEKLLFPDDMSVRSALVSSVVKVGRGTVSWGYDPLVLLVMVNPRTYTPLSLELNRNARTYTALALYENVRRFLAIGRAGPYPIRRWQELLSDSGEVRNWENVSEFRRKIRRALAELEATEGCDIDIEFREVLLSEGKGVEFGVQLRPQHRLLFGEPVPNNRELADELELLGFSQAECRAMVDAHGEEQLYAKLALLRKSREKQSIRDVRAWFAAALQQDWQDKEAVLSQEHEARSQSNNRKQELAQLREAFSAARSQEVAVKLLQLSPAEREQWLSRFADTDTGSRCSTQLGVGSKGFEAAWRHWLIDQDGWLTEDHLTDFTAYVLWAKSATPVAKPKIVAITTS